MYGWKARIGIILPYDNAVIEQEMFKLLPEGITCHSVRTVKTDRYKSPEQALQLAKNLLHLRVNIIVYACFASSFLRGIDFHQKLKKTLQEETKLSVVTPISAMFAVIKEKDLKDIVFVTPYPDWVNEKLYEFLKEQGLNILGIKGAGLEPIEVNNQSPQDVYRLAKEADKKEAKAIFVCATNFRTIEVLEYLERDLKKPVISTNQSLLWSLLRKLNISFDIEGYGSLLEKTNK